NVEKLLTSCSRPLCSSQETTPHQHHPANTAAAPGRTSHTPHTHHQPLDEQGIPATVGPRAASQPNSVSPPQTTQPRTFLTPAGSRDRKSTRLNYSHVSISYAVFCLNKKKTDALPRLPEFSVSWIPSYYAT